MAGKNKAVFGIYKTTGQAERVVERLMALGFSSDDVSVLVPYAHSSKQCANYKNTKAPEGTAAGATTGGVIGGALGLLAGVGALAIPGVGPFIAAGPVMAALAGLGAGGAAGGFIGALVGLGITEFEAKRYEGQIKGGGVILSVHSDTSEEVSRAKEALERTGAQDVSSTGEATADYTMKQI
jgi:hypothetical protein